jgi:hypothetical protein
MYSHCKELRLTKTRQVCAYCPILKRMQLTRRTLVEVLKNSRQQSWEMSETPVSDTVWCSFRWSLRVLFVTLSSQICAPIWPGRTLQNINVLSHTHKTQLNFSLMYFYWNTSVSDHKRRTAFPSANNCKVNCKLLILYQYFYTFEFPRRCYYSGVILV